jgi:hypothetical protein
MPIWRAVCLAGLSACATPVAPDVRGLGDRLQFLREPPNRLTVGVPVVSGVRVAIVDAAGGVVPRDGVTLTLRFVGALPPDSLPAPTTLTTVAGIATVAPFVVGRPLDRVQLVAVASGLTGVLSQEFSVVSPASTARDP